MVDLPARAARAGARIRLADGAGLARAAPFDLVLCDVPCSGSGAWRRSPEAKWALTQARLDELTAMQDAILDRAAPLVAAGGTLAYVTCSLLEVENADRIAAFLARTPGWQVVARRRLTPLDGGDGFYMAHLTRG
jgi:16S rRNA (cytosine967-C5)-methyltransferase